MPPKHKVAAAEFGYDLSNTAAQNVTEQLAVVCSHEKRRVEKGNEPAINGIKLRLGFLKHEHEHLLAVLLRPSTPLALCQRRRSNLAFALLFGLASLALGHLALSPLGLGWESWLLSAAFAGIGGYWTEVILARYHATRLMQAVFVGALLVSLTGLVVLAVLRGDVLTFSL